jgi:hypothetical protein
MPAQIARSIGTARVRRGEKALLAREAGKYLAARPRD